MTFNQKRAIHLASEIIDGRLRARDLTDGDWSLLLLASGMTGSGAVPIVICCAVLEHANAGTGYFAGIDLAEEGFGREDFIPDVASSPMVS